MKFWNDFAEKHPAAAKWVREGGLFVIVSNLITVFIAIFKIKAHIRRSETSRSNQRQ